MPLHNYDNDETRLGNGLGRLAADAVPSYDTPPIYDTAPIYDTVPIYDTAGDQAFTTYLDITPKGDNYGTDSTNEVPDSAIRTLSTSPSMLPALNYATGAASCTDCDSDTKVAAAATAAATAAAVVTPMPAAPTTVNWLLIAVGCGLGYALLKGKPKPGLGCAPEPAPVVQQDLGRPPRKPKPKADLKHVDTLEL